MSTKKSPAIFFRNTPETYKEFKIAQKYFNVYTSRMHFYDNLVIGRYSVLPNYKELVNDLYWVKSELINSYDDHSWIADFGYYFDLKKYTPKTYFSHSFFLAPEGQYVVKGVTNSCKHLWKTHMFAENKEKAIQIANKLRENNTLGEQEIIYREFEKLKTLDVDKFSSQPIVNEWRFFYYGNTLLSHGFYWSNAPQEVISKAICDELGLKFAQMISEIVSEYVDFYVIDIAQKENGDWILIEINDGQMAGLSECNADELYSNLRKVLQ